jgi:GTPase SAR1 family protein
MVTTEHVLDWVRAHPLPDKRIIPICLWGDSGVGKSSWVNGYCQQYHLGFRVYYPAHDTTGADIVGQAHIDLHNERTVYARPMWLPSDTDAVVFEDSGVLFIDEINRAPKAVLRGLMEPLGEGRISHSGWVLPVLWGFVCAANPPGEASDVDLLDKALVNRMLHIPMGFDAVRWAAWAGGADVHPDLITFTARYPNAVASAEPELPPTIQATPRTIEYLSRLYEPGMDRELLAMLAEGLIGAEPTAQFLAHVDSPERPVSAEEVFSDDAFVGRVAAHRAQNRDDLLDASETLVLAGLVRYRSSPEAALRVARYLQALGPERAKSVWGRLTYVAPHWQKAVQDVRAQAKRSS